MSVQISLGEPDSLHSTVLQKTMIRDVISRRSQLDLLSKNNQPKRSIQESQEVIFRYLLTIVKEWQPSEVLGEFKRLFIYHVDSNSSEALQALYEIVFANNDQEFRNTLKRSCYILINNWDATRQHQPIRELVHLFEDSTVTRQTASPTLKRLRQWLYNFAKSKDYDDLKLFVAKYDDQPEQAHWSQRYTSYLLVPQYTDLQNPREQREAARALAKQLRDKFKFDLAMYIARSQSGSQPPQGKSSQNPTTLGDGVLRLIKTVVARRGPFSYVNLANIFINQTRDLKYRDFKKSLLEYLLFSINNPELVELLRKRLPEKLDALYERYNDDPIHSALLLRTCNRLIDFLTIENGQEPSALFAQLLSQGNPLTIVIVLLKIILICRNARTYLEMRIAELVRYYGNYPEEECQWIVHFMEVFNITFTIYAENVRYNLVRMPDDVPIPDNNQYKIFSQLRYEEGAESGMDELSEQVIEPEISPEETMG